MSNEHFLNLGAPLTKSWFILTDTILLFYTEVPDFRDMFLTRAVSAVWVLPVDYLLLHLLPFTMFVFEVRSRESLCHLPQISQY